MSKEDANSICIDRETIKGFLETEYILSELDMALLIGEQNMLWSKWCRRHDWEYYGLLTAYNPLCKMTSQDLNISANRHLLDRLANNANLIVNTEHIAKSGQWPIERGFAAAIPFELCSKLADEFDQAGFVWGYWDEFPILYLNARYVKTSQKREFSAHPHIRFYESY